MASPTISAIGPLTTPFTEPSWCSTVIQSSGYDYQERGGTCGSDGTFTRASACFPTGRPVLSTSEALVYSPAVACPVGWTASIIPSPPLVSTTVACCPVGYTETGSNSCWMTRSIGSLSVYSCSGSVPVPATNGFGSASVLSAYAVQVRIGLEPLTSSSIASSSASPGASSSRTTSRPTTNPATPDPGSEPKKKLSGGAIAGIVIGALAFFLLLAGAVLFFLRRRKQQANHGMSASGPHHGGDLPEFVAAGPQPYANSTAYESHTKIPPVTAEKANTPSLRTGVSPIPTTPTQADPSELFFPTTTTQRTSDVSELASPQQNHHQTNRDTYSTTTSATYPRSPLSEMTSFGSPHDSQVAKLEAEKAALEERIARMRQLAQMEEEQAGMRAELERLRGSAGR